MDLVLDPVRLCKSDVCKCCTTYGYSQRILCFCEIVVDKYFYFFKQIDCETKFCKQILLQEHILYRCFFFIDIFSAIQIDWIEVCNHVVIFNIPTLIRDLVDP